MRPAACIVAATLAGCVQAPVDDGIDADLGPIEAALTDEDRRAWPGVDAEDGRVVTIQNGFFDGQPAAAWSFGPAPRDTADSFWFCRLDDEGCPLDASRRIDWDRAVGLPLVSRLPGQDGYSPYWQLWVVRVAADYAPNSVKTADTLHEWASLGEIAVEPLVAYFPDPEGETERPEEVVVHFPLVLDGTRLEGNGAPLVAEPRRTSMFMETRQAWHEGLLVNLIDFSRSEGVFPEADDSESRSLMPFAEVFELLRACDEPGCDAFAVSEPRLGRDLTGDGDQQDTNDVFAALPCDVAASADSPYSPLRRVRQVEVDPRLSLIDRSRDDASSDVRSVVELDEALGSSAGRELETLLEDLPAQVCQDHVPFPCRSE